jgi:hypothetical protein
VGLYGLWHNAPYTEAFHDIACDLGLVVSNDGLRFREPVKGHVYVAREDSPATPVPCNSYNTVLCQANGILNVGHETRIYHGRWRNVGDRAEHMHNYRADVALATIPRDRWGALGLFPGAEDGAVWSAPVALPENGCELSLNADAAETMQVEAADRDFNPLPALCAENAGRAARGSGLDCAVSWPGRRLRALGGKTLRFRITVQRKAGKAPRLYAINLSAPSETASGG